MGYSLLIVESPNKVKKLEEYLRGAPGGPWRVAATVGHWRGLPEMDGQSFESVVDPSKEFEERFVVQNRKVEQNLRRAIGGATRIYLASDPDREGEAIAWHLERHFKLSKAARVTFGEITCDAVRRAVASPGRIDYGLVESQRTRQTLDYLYGMKVSRRLWRFGAKSAGRVQSCALRVLVERERAIQDFVARGYWTLRAEYGEGLSAELAVVQDPTDSERDAAPDGALEAKLVAHRFFDEHEAKRCKARLRAAKPHVVEKVEGTSVERRPPPPFTTASLLAAANDAGIAPAKATALAQALFEKGLITYIRTDSVHLSGEAIEAIRAYLSEKQPRLLPETPQTHKSGADSQEAHEAIRPTDIWNAAPQGLSAAEASLYALIHRRTLVSQAASAIFDRTKIVIAPGNEPERLRAQGSVLRVPGFLALTGGSPDDVMLPALQTGQELTLDQVSLKAGKTKPPPRFTVRSLIRYLERRGIGRPSTYNALLTTLFERAYAQERGKQLIPGELGFVAHDLLEVGFSKLTEEDFTRITERSLDKIARGSLKRSAFLSSFYENLERLLERSVPLFERYAQDNPERDRDARVPHDSPCPSCGAEMLRRLGRHGPFARCTACEKTLDLSPPKHAKHPCPKCSSPVLEKAYRKDGKRKRFYVCTQCAWRSAFAPAKARKAPCPKCGAAVFKRKSSRGAFWGCSSYPECRYTADA